MALLDKAESSFEIDKEEALSQLVALQNDASVSRRRRIDGRIAAPVEIIIGHLDEKAIYPQRRQGIIEFLVRLPEASLEKTVYLLLLSMGSEARSAAARDILQGMIQRAYLLVDVQISERLGSLLKRISGNK